MPSASKQLSLGEGAWLSTRFPPSAVCAPHHVPFHRQLDTPLSEFLSVCGLIKAVSRRHILQAPVHLCRYALDRLFIAVPIQPFHNQCGLSKNHSGSANKCRIFPILDDLFELSIHLRKVPDVSSSRLSGG